MTEIGATLTGIEVSLTSVLKALAFTGLAQEQMQSNTSWNLMLISSNGYSICSMVGKNIVDYYEEPLAIKSFEGDEIYNAISASAQITLMSYPANSLFVLSETDMVSAELLSRRIQTEGQILYWGCNRCHCCCTLSFVCCRSRLSCLNFCSIFCLQCFIFIV